MYSVLLTIHIIACLMLIFVVLLQAGRGAGLAVFGSSGDTVFASPSGSSFLKQFTAILAGTFAVTSLMLTLLSSRVGLHSVTGRQLSIPAPLQQGQRPQTTNAPGQAPRQEAPAPAPKSRGLEKPDEAKKK